MLFDAIYDFTKSGFEESHDVIDTKKWLTQLMSLIFSAKFYLGLRRNI